MTLPGMTSQQFKNKTQQFLTSFEELLQGSGYSDVDVTIHAVYFDEELQWVHANWSFPLPPPPKKS